MGGAALEAERRPVAEHVAALLPEPVGSLPHTLSVTPPYPKIELHVHLEGTVRARTLLGQLDS